MKIKYLVKIILMLVLIIPKLTLSAPDGYLKKGTYSLNPDNKQDIFLYIPGKTLLYSISPEEVVIGSKAFPDLQRTYIKATTQDGVDVLVWKDEVKTNIASLARFDFFVNRRLPLCLTLDSCESIWEKFNRVSDEGDGWLAIWPGAGGKLFENIGGNQKVKVDAGGWEDGYIPLRRGRLNIEEYGYITNLKRAYPLYSFNQIELDGLNTKCGETISSNKKSLIFSKVEAYGKASAKLSIDPSAALPKLIPKKYVKRLLESLGLDASISAEAFIDGRWKTEETKTDVVHTVYGQANESWHVQDILIEKRSITELGTDSDYKPYGRILSKKVYGCQGAELSSLKYASFTLTFYDENGNLIDDSSIPVSMDRNVITNEVGIGSSPLSRALVSVNKKSDHFRLVDFFLARGIPKSLSNYLIKEINLSRSSK